MFDKVPYTGINICGIELDFGGHIVPSNIGGFQPFCDSVSVTGNFVPAYFGKSTVSFKEEPIESNGGTAYQQKVTFRFPATDNLRATRIQMFQKLTYVKLKLSNGLSILVGRNDFFQNAKPRIDFNADHSKLSIEITSLSVAPAGFCIDQQDVPNDVFIPVNP